MIACRLEAGIESAEDAAPGVRDAAGLAVHQFRCPDHLAAHRLPDGLVAEADAEDRRRGAEAIDEGEADARFGRRLRAGGKQDGIGGQLFDAVEGELVVAIDEGLGPQFADIVHEVVGEAVVVIDDEEAHGFVRFGWGAISWFYKLTMRSITNAEGPSW